MADDFDGAAAALTEYGYVPVADPEWSVTGTSYERSKGGTPRDRWVPVEAGFERYTRADGAWRAVPYTIHEEFEGVSGLDPDKHPGCFEWVYPAGYVEGVYTTALAD